MDEEIRIMIAGGGTGGHLYPALAIGEEIMQRTSNVKVHYIGSEFGLEANIFPNASPLVKVLAAVGMLTVFTVNVTSNPPRL